MALGRQQLLVGRLGLIVRDALDFGHIPSCARFLDCAQGPAAFPPGCGGQPASKRRRVAECFQVFHQLQPDVLADVVGISAANLVPAADGLNERGVPLDQLVPGLLVAVSGTGHQVNDPQVVLHRYNPPYATDSWPSAACHPSRESPWPGDEYWSSDDTSQT